MGVVKNIKDVVEGELKLDSKKEDIMENKKQEIISYLDEMDEDSLDWILSLLKRRPRKQLKSNPSDDLEMKEIWNHACEIMEKELTEVSYNTWIKNITPIKIKEDVFKLFVSNEFHKGIIEGRYSKLISNALYYATDRRFKLEFLNHDDIEQ